MRIKKLFKDIDCSIKGSKEIEIKGLCQDSRICSFGNLFIAKNFEANNFISEAISAGATAVLTNMYNPFIEGITQIICKDTNKVGADIAAIYYGFPAKQLFPIGITGTNGKTTTSYLIKHILQNVEKPCGLLGSVEYIFNKTSLISSLTTPDAISLQKYLKEMVLEGCKYVVMEVSSHGLHQKRVRNVDFNIAIFTNLTQDHLDYHKSFEDYLKAKKMLFDSLKKDAVAIVNVDDKNSKPIIQDTKAKVISYGIENKAYFTAKNIKFSSTKTFFDLIFEDKKIPISTNLIGRFNVYNVLAAIAACLYLNIPVNEIKKHLNTFKNTKGRLQRVGINKKFQVFIDSAHTPDALKNTLQALNEIKKAKVITVIGCGGNRDALKRPQIGKIASELSDFCIITSDNPRKECPKKIMTEIKQGIFSNNYLLQEDRYLAIKKAVEIADENDIVLIAGKGHETTQIFDNKTIFFHDELIVKKIVKDSNV